MSAGATRLVVASTVLAGATYPVTIDPEIRGYELRISDMGGTGDPDYDAASPAVAYNSTNHQYLVVWSGEENIGGLVDGEIEIFGQRIDAATGAELGANDFRISDMGSTGNFLYAAVDPAVAYNSTDNEYLVVWEGDDNVGGLVDGEYEIFGQRLDAVTGLAVGANDFRISEMGGTGGLEFGGFRPAPAFGGDAGQLLVAWHADDNTGGLVDNEYEIFGKLLGILPFEDGFESGDTSGWSTTVP